MWILLVNPGIFKLLDRIEFPQSFPGVALQDLQVLIVVQANVANSIDLIRKMLHLALISFDKILQHLLGANANFKVIHFLLKLH